MRGATSFFGELGHLNLQWLRPRSVYRTNRSWRVSDEACQPHKQGKKLKKLKQSNKRNGKLRVWAKHQGAYTRLVQAVGWNVTAGVHTDLNTPPAASMFGWENKWANPLSKSTSNDIAALGDAVAGMVGSLSQTLSPSVHAQQAIAADKSGQAHNSSLTPMKSAELRRIYMKQIGELRQLYDNGVLSMRSNGLNSIRRLKK